MSLVLKSCIPSKRLKFTESHFTINVFWVLLATGYLIFTWTKWSVTTSFSQISHNRSSIKHVKGCKKIQLEIKVSKWHLDIKKKKIQFTWILLIMKEEVRVFQLKNQTIWVLSLGRFFWLLVVAHDFSRIWGSITEQSWLEDEKTCCYCHFWVWFQA